MLTSWLRAVGPGVGRHNLTDVNGRSVGPTTRTGLSEWPSRGAVHTALADLSALPSENAHLAHELVFQSVLSQCSGARIGALAYELVLRREAVQTALTDLSALPSENARLSWI